MRGGFHMGPEQRHAVKAAKEALKKAMTLALPDPNQPFTLEVDASRTGFGAVLMQGDRPIHFASKQLSPTEAGLQVTLLELAATVWAQSPHLAAWCPVPLQEAGHHAVADSLSRSFAMPVLDREAGRLTISAITGQPDSMPHPCSATRGQGAAGPELHLGCGWGLVQAEVLVGLSDDVTDGAQ